MMMMTIAKAMMTIAKAMMMMPTAMMMTLMTTKIMVMMAGNIWSMGSE